MHTPNRMLDALSSIVGGRDRPLRHDAPPRPIRRSGQQWSIRAGVKSQYAPVARLSAVALVDATAVRLNAIALIAGRS